MKCLKISMIYSALVCMLVSASARARTAENFGGNSPTEAVSANNDYCNTFHDVGKIALGVSNDGTFGTGLSVGGGTDCFTGETPPSCEYPKGTATQYIFGAAMWIGGILGRDTLVSTGADGWSVAGNEFHPETKKGGGSMIFRSTIDPAASEFDGAVSEEDYIGVYYDTCRNCSGVTPDPIAARSHIPLNLEITQSTYAWSYDYAEDFVLFDYGIKNIGQDRLRRIYIGFYVDADIHDRASAGQGGAQDDLCGFREYQPASYLPANCAPDSDIVNIAWTIDNDGDLSNPPNSPAVPNVTATRIIRTPADSLEVSFNWWISNSKATLDWGPQTKAKFRDFGTGGLGTPEGDQNKFHVLSNGEFDYDQPRVAQITPLDSIWLDPGNKRDFIPKGLDTRYVLSFGPFDVEPGQTLPVTLSYVGGENFHLTESNFNNLPYNPDAWYAGVDFSDLGLNATWADWIYDNPGVDTDSDGYAGEMTVCNGGGDSTVDSIIIDSTIPQFPDTTYFITYEVPDTIWRKGDGVPDFRGASPPPAPKVRVEPSIGKINVVWDGHLSENTRDVFSRELDFEGYRVYLSRDDRPSSYMVVASYDQENYNKYVWSQLIRDYVLLDAPYLIKDLRAQYGGTDPAWDPLAWTRTRPFILPGFPDSIFYFAKQDFNMSILASDDSVYFTSPIRKKYKNAPKPPFIDVDTLKILFPNGADSIYLDEFDFIKYYTYEYTITDLLPTVPWWVNVTAFDFGSPQSGLAALETSPTINPGVTFALESTANVDDKNLKVYVYPNPYRLDADYRDRGFEGRSEADIPVDRTREIHFANLPTKCRISIFSLDGDLVREFDHEGDPQDPLSNHDSWDIITRNSQQAVSGLYYWTVEEDNGKTQIGKFAIIM